MSSYLNRYDLIDLNFSSMPRNAKGQASVWDCSHDPLGRQVCKPKPFADTAARCVKRAGCMLSLNSERFLALALYRANITVVRMRWAFCKYGSSAHAWPGCAGGRRGGGGGCKSFNCPSWMAGGCSCAQNTTCSPKAWS